MAKDMDTSEYWRETEIISLVRNNEADIDYDKCERSNQDFSVVQFVSQRTVRPICRSRIGKKVIYVVLLVDCMLITTSFLFQGFLLFAVMLFWVVLVSL